MIAVASDERIYPSFGHSNFAFYLSRYLWGTQFAYGKVVLDAGCSSGYGSQLLASVAHDVVGADRKLSPQTRSATGCSPTVRRGASTGLHPANDFQ
jgi:hypothetical protein